MYILFFILSFLFINPAQAGLVPCFGPDCTFCHFFLLFQNLFNFAIWTMAPLIATAFVVYGGYMYLISAGNTSKLESAKSILKNTVIGLLIVYGSYAIASSLIGALAPNTEDFGFKKGVFSFSCKAVSSAVDTSGVVSNGTITVKLEGEVIIDSANVASAPSMASGEKIGVIKVDTKDGVDLQGVNGPVKVSLARVSQAAALSEKGISLVVTSAKRTLESQKNLVAKNCASGTCNPATCKPNADGSNCPHVAGRALDVWGWQNGAQCGKTSACQKEVIRVMRDVGHFCNLVNPIEQWHFEYPSRNNSNCN